MKRKADIQTLTKHQAPYTGGVRLRSCLSAGICGIALLLGASWMVASAQIRVMPAAVTPSDANAAGQKPANPFGMPRPAFPASAPEKRTFTEEFVYELQHYSYTPAIQVKPVSKTGADYSTPEGACIAILSSMQAKDYDWFIESWDKKSGPDIRETDRQHGGVAATQKEWQQGIVGRRLEITERLDSGQYAVLYFRVFEAGKLTPSLNTIFVFIKEGNRWVATNQAEILNGIILTHQGETAKETHAAVLTPLLNGTGRLENGELNPEDIAQTDLLREYPRGKTRVIRKIQ